MNTQTTTTSLTPLATSTDALAAYAAPSDGELERAQLRQQLESRFRHSLRSGQLSPLLHLVMRYKMEGGV